MITAAKLVDGDRTMVLIPRDDLDVTKIDAPMPTVREVSEMRSEGDGARDSTDFFGPRAVSVEMDIWDQPAAVMDELNGFLHPRLRPYLVITDDEWGSDRRIQLRSAAGSSPVVADGSDRIHRTVQVQWIAPDALWEDVDLTQVVISAEATGSTGITFPITLPKIWPTTVTTGSTQITMTGQTPTDYVARLYGPCDGPRLTHAVLGSTTFRLHTDSAGGLQVLAGEYVEIDTKNRTAYYLSDPGANRLVYMDYSSSVWWDLLPGTNLIRYNPLNAVGAGCMAVIEYRQKYL